MDRQVMISKLIGTAPKPFWPVDQQTAADIMYWVKSKHYSCTRDYDRIVNMIDPSQRIEDICYELWQFCKKELIYKPEPGARQSVSCPYTILTTRKIDCKNYALFIAGMLDALKRRGYQLTWFFRFASYEFWDPDPGHVFVVVNHETDNIWVDPVMDEFDTHAVRYFYHKDKKVKAAAIGRIPTSSISGTWLSPEPPANLNLDGPVPMGTTNGYGTATWIPSGYPTKTQPYLYNGRLVLRPLTQITEVNVNTAIPYIMAALQVAINQYAPTPYSILYSNSLGNAPSRIKNQTLATVNTFARAGAGIDDWLQLPPQPSGLDQILTFASTAIPSVVAAGINALVPGLGTEVLNAIKGVTAQGSSAETQINNATQQIIQSAARSSQLIPGVSNRYLYGALALIALYGLTNN